jgi:hypothetical protein
MTQEEQRKQKALEYLNRCKMLHMQTTMGLGGSFYDEGIDVVSITDAKRAIEMVLK